MNEDLFNQITQTDQAITAAMNMAKIAAAYYDALIAEGINETLAAALVIDWQGGIMRKPPETK